MTETIDEFAMLHENNLLFDLSTSFPEDSKSQRLQDFLKNIKITTQLSKKGEVFTTPDFSYFRESNFFRPRVQLEFQKLFGMFSPQVQPFYVDKKLTENAEFSRRIPVPSFFRRNDSTYFRTDYKVLQKTGRRTILSYRRMPEDIKNGQHQSKLEIKGMAMIENATGMLLHRRELLLGLDTMEYLMVINRKDTQEFSLDNRPLYHFKHSPFKTITLDQKQISRLFSMQKYPDSFESKAKARRYIQSLPSFLFYHKSSGNSAQLHSKSIDTQKMIMAEVEWLKGFDANDKMVFRSEFSENESSFPVPIDTSDGLRKMYDTQFIIPDTIKTLRGSITFNMEIGTKSRELTKSDIGRKISLTNSYLKILSWNDSTLSFVGLGSLKFYDRNGTLILPKKASFLPHFVPMITALLNKEPEELTKEDFFLYASIDDFPRYERHYSLHFERPVSKIKVLESEKVQPITRTFTIKKK